MIISGRSTYHCEPSQVVLTFTAGSSTPLSQTGLPVSTVFWHQAVGEFGLRR